MKHHIHTHTVKTSKWINGILKTERHLFQKLEHALTFLLDADFHNAKVYNEHGQCICMETKSTEDQGSYA